MTKFYDLLCDYLLLHVCMMNPRHYTTSVMSRSLYLLSKCVCAKALFWPATRCESEGLRAPEDVMHVITGCVNISLGVGITPHEIREGWKHENYLR